MSTIASELRLGFNQLGERIQELRELTGTGTATGRAVQEENADAPEGDGGAGGATNAEGIAEAEGAARGGADLTADVYWARVEKLQAAWESFAKTMEERIAFEELLQRALLSQVDDAGGPGEELRQKAVEAINEEIERLRGLISQLVQIHNYRL